MFSNPKKMKNNKSISNSSFSLQNLLILGIVLVFMFIVFLFASQYGEYKKIEKKLDEAYTTPLDYNLDTEKLYLLFSEADMFFRMFTLDYEDSSFALYKTSLDSINYYIDSLSLVQAGSSNFDQAMEDFELKNRYASEFAVLKKTMDNLILSNTEDPDPFSSLNTNYTRQSLRSDTVITKLSQETTPSPPQDTIIRERESLFRRIFRSKNDTIIVNTASAKEATRQQIEVIQKSTENQLNENKVRHQTNINAIRSTFSRLQEKERQLIILNFDLLDQLEAGINNLRLANLNSIRESESRDFGLFRSNSDKFRTQLIMVMPLMLILIGLLIYYQRKTKLKESQLIEEVKYSNKLAEEKTNILAGISHEIRSPLNALVNITKILDTEEKAYGESERTKLTESAYYHINSINNTVSDILTLNSMKEGIKLREFSEQIYFSPTTAIEKIATPHKHQAKFKNIDFEMVTTIDSDFYVYGYKFKVGQILSNLIENALKYTPPGGQIKIISGIRKRKGQQYLQIRVEDNGIGMHEKHLNQIFRKYYTANPTTGFGLGLFVAQTIADQINANITVHSKLDFGSTFELIIPFKKSKQNISLDVQEESGAKTTHSVMQRLNILVVDDNPINLLYIKQLLKNGEAIVHEASDTEQAIEILDKQYIDAIITDIHLPKQSGWDLLKHVRSVENLKHIPTYSTTASIDLPESNYGLTFDGALPKPFNENDLIVLLGQHFGS